MEISLLESAPSNWPRTTLGEIVQRGGGSIQTGPFGSQLHASDYVPVGVPSIMPFNIGDNRLIREEIACISEADAQRLSKHIVRKGDIIYSRRGDVERRALVRDAEDGWFCGTGCLKLRLGTGVVVPEFAAFFLGHPEIRSWIVRHAVGITMPNLNTSIMEAVPFLLPPIEEQQQIAETLQSLDDKIEQNRRTGRKLEELARAVFKAWFVDFEPVKAKAAGATAFPGMPPETFAALPKTLKDSPLGPVPQGWEISLLGDEIRIVKGRSYKSTELQESRTALVTLKSIERGGGYRPDGLKPYVGVYKPDQILNAGDLVIAFTDLTQDAAVVGKPAIVRRDERFDILVASLDLGIVRPCGRLGIAYLYCLCKTEDFQRHVYGHTNGSTVLHLGKVGVPTYPIALPNTSTLSAFDMFAAPLFDMMFASEAESVKLATLRDYLLPRLLSGKVRVRG